MEPVPSSPAFALSSKPKVGDWLLILDLDETLIHACDPSPSREGFRVGPYMVLERPGARAFLRWAHRYFQLAIWTTASRGYAHAILRQLCGEDLPFVFIWCRERCTSRGLGFHEEPGWRKDLKKVRRLGWSLAHVLILEDRPENCDRHYGNVIPISPFTGDPGDRELARLRNFLLDLRSHDDVRLIEKRNWRRHYMACA